MHVREWMCVCAVLCSVCDGEDVTLGQHTTQVEDLAHRRTTAS